MKFPEKDSVFLSVSEIESLFGGADLTDLASLGAVQLQIGEEFTRYVDGFLSSAENLSAESLLPMFFNHGRFQSTVTLFEYLKSSSRLHASGRNLPRKFLRKVPEDLFDVRLFAGRASNRSGLHFDWNLQKNVIFNVLGTKTFRLYSPERSHELGGFGNIAHERVRLESPEPDLTITISEGEGLLIDTFWWHEVDYVTDAVSISVRCGSSVLNNPDYNLTYPSWKFTQAWHSLGNKALDLLHHDPLLWEDRLREHSSGKENHRFYEAWSSAFVHFKRVTENHEFRV